MKSAQQLLTALLGALLLTPVAARADDIDIYSGFSPSAGLPNVLIILDNSANWNSPFVAEKAALVSAVGSLNDTVNLGLMMFAETGGGNDSIDGGYVRFGVRKMTGTNKTALAAIVNGLDVLNDKSNNAVYGLPMHEAYLYFGGLTSRASFGKAKRDYRGNTVYNPLASPLPGNAFTSATSSTFVSPVNDSCQKNFIIFISNGPAGDNASATSTSTTLLSGVGGNTTAIPLSPNGEQGNTADEWARFLSSHDVNGSVAGDQTIRTYTIDVNPGTTGQGPAHTALMKSMATQGRGKYFAVTGDATAIGQAILKILNEVQAVNSVFASSSLPVSVNAQGTFLNQIFMGMFRPDENAMPRWAGNLKQYQFKFDSVAQSLFLADSIGQPAISSSGTGFISPNAVSFWSTKNTAVEPDLGGGFWRNAARGAALGYDSPDGELVEKGGAAHVLRLSNLFDDYVANPATPRKVYTYCPSGSSCNPALTASSNAFATTNTGIPSAAFGASNIAIRSIVRTGTTALVTTNTAHGYTSGMAVTISGALQSAYNGTFFVTVNSSTTFTISGLQDLPTSPTLGTYLVSLHNTNSQAIATLTRSSSATSTANTETATLTTAMAHGFITGESINITGATPTNYNGIKTVASVPSSTTLTFPVTISPPATAVNSYTAVIHPYTAIISSIAKVTGNYTVTTTAAHGFHAGQTITISQTTASFNGTWVISSVPSATTFILPLTGNLTAFSAGNGQASPSTIPVAITTLTRTGTTLAATATATGLTAGYFANGDLVDITTSGTSPNEANYKKTSGVTITCTTSPANTIGAPCTGTTFTYPITVIPDISATGTMNVALATTPFTVPAGTISRSGGTATVTGVSNTLTHGDVVDISATGAITYNAESAYTGTWTISCPISCSTSFSFGAVTLTPTTPATGSMSCYSGQAPPDPGGMIRWLRGQDNLCDEASPEISNCPSQTTINIRPSVHGDVLHSRPTVINYGGTTGVVVYYGANDGVYRAINGNQTNAIGSTPAGGELWSFIPSEFYGQITRMHDNAPLLLLSTTPPGILPTPKKKDYFIDGSTSVYQKLNADGTSQTAYLYLAMRRGGSFVYALDVTDPTSPRYMWKISNLDADFNELGQTWSQPTVGLIKGYCGGTACSSTDLPTPVLIFGGGYDANAEDAEPPTADTMGRGIFIVDAATGALVWKATYGTSSGCSGTAFQSTCTVAGMNYSIPADLTLLDISGNDGYIDRLYAVDLGGNIWRVDLEPTTTQITPNFWHVTKLAALGCNTGNCASGVTPRKFFYPVDVVHTPAYDAVLAGSGDREHPLLTHQAYTVTNRFYMVKDTNVGNSGSGLTTPITEADLVDITPVPPATTSTYDNTLSGYYLTLAAGEKVVNAPLTVAGYTYFGTNTPIASSSSCTANLGAAKGYRIKPLTGVSSSVTYDGGGLPPTAVAGMVEVDGKVLPFCIGCGGNPDTDCRSALCGETPEFDITSSRYRTYWYLESD